jgi:hypothetical protein
MAPLTGVAGDGSHCKLGGAGVELQHPNGHLTQNDQQQQQQEDEEEGETMGQGQRPQAAQITTATPQHHHQQAVQAVPQTSVGKPFYHGYRTDLVAVLSNCLFGRKAVQDLLLELGAVELLLSCCQLDEAAPLAKEWALWGVRNLCEGNAQVQEYIRQLKVVDTVGSPELEQMGMRLQLDKRTGKMKLVQEQQT